MKRKRWPYLVPLVMALLMACDGGPDLDTRTFTLRYLPPHQARELIEPYVYGDREGAAGRLSTARGAITVRETEDNLSKIERVLEEFDRPNPMVTLHFQVIEADGAGESDPAIAAVERELRRLFRFDGYALAAETQVATIEGSAVRQLVGEEASERAFLVEASVREVRSMGADATVTLQVQLSANRAGAVMETAVTIPTGHSVVLGTARAPGFDGALILVVRAELTDPAGVGASAADPAGPPGS